MLFTANFEALYELAPSRVAITLGAEHRLLYMNAALRAQFGDIEYKGLPVAQLLEVADERGEIVSYLDKVFQTGEQIVRRAVPMASRPSAAEHLECAYFDALYHPLVDADGSILGVFVEGHDVTARVELQSLRQKACDKGTAPPLPILTPRQRQLLSGLLRGLCNKQIAYKLGISERTAEMHRRALLRRLGVRTTAQLIAVVARQPELAATGKDAL